jgi:hypothetical protein
MYLFAQNRAFQLLKTIYLLSFKENAAPCVFFETGMKCIRERLRILLCCLSGHGTSRLGNPRRDN